MRIARRLAVVLPVLALAVAAAYPFLPDSYEVERRVVIRAGRDAIHAWVGDLERWPDWTGWTREELRAGSVEVTSDLPRRGLWYDLPAAGGGNPSKGAVMYAATDEGTAVVWIQRGPLTGWRRYRAGATDARVGRELERNLATLQERVEAGEPSDPR